MLSSGITLGVKAVSTPVYPLVENSTNNLIKLYLNDVGILTSVLYQANVDPILTHIASINLGSVYECVVASELKAHDHELYYYDNKKNGEVDFLTNDDANLKVLPIEVKSGKNYSTHHALDTFLADGKYPVDMGIVLSNEREIKVEGKVKYCPIYDVMYI